MFFKTNLSYLRRKRELSQEDVATCLGLTKQSIAQYESGTREPSLENLILLSHICRVSIDELLTKDLRPTWRVLSNNIRYLRKSEGYTQREMANLLKVEDPAISKYESGLIKPSIEVLMNLSEFFGIAIDDLLKKDLSKEG